MVTTIAGDKVEYDPEATRALYSNERVGVECTCDGCTNFQALGAKAFPPKAMELFERLGIDCLKPGEAYHNGKLESGLHSYGGWFHFVGTFHGQNAPVQSRGPGGIEKLDDPSTGAVFQYHCSEASAPCREVFRGKQVVQLDFYSELPWVIKQPEML